MSDWRAWARSGVSVVDAEGRCIEGLAVQGKRRFFVRYRGERCARCGEYLRVTELAEFVASRDEKQMRHVLCPDGSAKQT